MFIWEDIRPDGFFTTTPHYDENGILDMIREREDSNLAVDIDEPLYKQFIIDMFYRWNMERGGWYNISKIKDKKMCHIENCDPFGFYDWINRVDFLSWPSFIKLKKISEDLYDDRKFCNVCQQDFWERKTPLAYCLCAVELTYDDIQIAQSIRTTVGTPYEKSRNSYTDNKKIILNYNF